MPRGGARPGAGWPRKPKLGPASPPDQTPIEFLLATMRDPGVDMRVRIMAAKAALPLGSKRSTGVAASDDGIAVDDWANILKFKK